MGRRRLVVSDLDGTLLGDDVALTRFKEWRRKCPSDIALVYASGRLYESVVAAVDSTTLPEPDAVIGAVGTQIRSFPDGRPLLEWPQARAPRWDAAMVRHALACFKSLEFQPDEFQSDLKVSYYLANAHPNVLQRIEAVLRHRGLAFELVYSSGKDLDVLPHGVSKGSAVRVLAQHWSIDEEDVIVCGDTGNDLAMFRLGCRGVVVANAHDELKQLASERVYLAQARYAAGVVEGLNHWLGDSF